ncbi:tetratricopeptide repeat protein [Nostoc sp. WHI]|uniref:tetratricopeptide repeat protein n=1 Tax=Nostoc sp. WHI TaxID=2650611 RepID=UPI0018C4AA65|nr:tetratricopeptide repeat protein [Nostoc sp. WHI]MBG1266173.1 tetratricopeptide repeat protein [Nostoc sp. WHI]
MKQRLVFPMQKIDLVYVARLVHCSCDQSCSSWRAIYHRQVFLHCFLLFTFFLSPIAAGTVDITQQLHRPLNSSVGRQSRNEADSLIRIGEQQYTSGYADKTITSCLRALEIYHSIGDIKAQGLTYNLLAKAYIQLGSLKEAEDALRRGLAIARDTKDFQSQIFVLNSIGTFLLQQGEPAAGKTVEDALTIAHNVKNIEGEGLSLSNLGLVAARLGDYNRAVKLYENALIFRRQIGDAIGEANTLNNLGDAYLASRNYQDTIGTYGAAMVIAKTNRDRTNELRAIDGLVKAHSAVGRYERAFDLLEQRLKLAKELQNLREELKSFESYAQLYEQQGNYITARNFYERAIILARTLEDRKQEVLLLDRLTKMLRRKNTP